MEDFWEEHGYTLNGQSEGPFAVLYKQHPGVLRAHQVAGVQLADPEDSAVVEGAALLLCEYFAVWSPLKTPRWIRSPAACSAISSIRSAGEWIQVCRGSGECLLPDGANQLPVSMWEGIRGTVPRSRSWWEWRR